MTGQVHPDLHLPVLPSHLILNGGQRMDEQHLKSIEAELQSILMRCAKDELAESLKAMCLFFAYLQSKNPNVENITKEIETLKREDFLQLYADSLANVAQALNPEDPEIVNFLSEVHLLKHLKE